MRLCQSHYTCVQSFEETDSYWSKVWKYISRGDEIHFKWFEPLIREPTMKFHTIENTMYNSVFKDSNVDLNRACGPAL